MNARERLAAAAEWLGWNHEQLSFGLRNAFDALRLHDYAMAHPDLPEMADEWDEKDLIAALGYTPWAVDETESPISHEAETSGADIAAETIYAARRLIDSVAYVKEPGDKDAVLAAIDAVVPS